jgi:protein gp37
VSEGCRNCYAERVAGRFSGPGQPYEGLVTVSSRHPQTGAATTGVRPKWTGEVRFVADHLADPLRWRKPRRVFVNSMSDVFHEKVTDEQIAAVFGVMASAPQHTFQVLTKRPERMRAWFRWLEDRTVRSAWQFAEDEPAWRRMHWLRAAFLRQGCGHAGERADDMASRGWPLPNVWLGVSCEDQRTADERIPLLLETPAAVRFVSYEPALGPVDFLPWLYVPTRCRSCGGVGAYYDTNPRNLPTRGTCVMGVPMTGEPGAVRCGSCDSLEVDEQAPLDWVIAGSESGPGARPAELDWFRSVRDQCAAAGVPFFFKQWVGDKHSAGEVARDRIERRGRVKVSLPVLDGRQHVEWPRTLTLEDTLP